MRDLLPKLEHLPWTYALPVLSLFICFTAVTIWAYRRGAKDLYETMAALPLREDIEGTRKERSR